MTLPDDTIAAPASPPGPALRGSVRVSGAETKAVLEQCFHPDDAAAWQSIRRPWRHAGRIELPGWRTPVPAAVLFWPGARSYTGAPTAEIQLPGSPPLIEAVLARLYAAGARPARAGEFTLRAFLAGRIDLTQAEAVLGVIDAEDHVQLRQALDQLAGGLSGRILALREQLLLHLADLEAGLDFVEEDIDFVHRVELRRRLAEAAEWLHTLQAQAEGRLQSTGRRQVVLAGLPNAGKSTLFNRLAAREAAIVSSRRGTTRDLLSVDLDLAGTAVTLWDTAGWEETADPIDLAAAVLREDRLDRADLVVWCSAADAGTGERFQDDLLKARIIPRRPVLFVQTKSELSPGGTGDPTGASGVLMVSAATGAGLMRLVEAIAAALHQHAGDHGELLSATAARCRESLRQSTAALRQALESLDAGAGDELIAMDLRAGLTALGEICGAVYTDDVLDRIFSRFCIGK